MVGLVVLFFLYIGIMRDLYSICGKWFVVNIVLKIVCIKGIKIFLNLMKYLLIILFSLWFLFGFKVFIVFLILFKDMLFFNFLKIIFFLFMIMLFFMVVWLI